MGPVRAKKRLGQNFLVNPAVAARIVAESAIGPDDDALEIGPGMGALTRPLSAAARTVTAVEVDPALADYLRGEFAGSGNVTVVCGDILDYDLAGAYPPGGAVPAVISNLPYYITTPIIFKVLESGVPIKSMTLMVQSEVADRLLAPPGTKEYGVLTVTAAYHCKISKVMDVHPHSFSPQPGVGSTVLRFVPWDRGGLDAADIDLFRDVVRAAFGMRRKTVANALRGYRGRAMGGAAVLGALDGAGIDGGRRGETLSLPEFIALANRMHGG